MNLTTKRLIGIALLAVAALFIAVLLGISVQDRRDSATNTEAQLHPEERPSMPKPAVGIDSGSYGTKAWPSRTVPDLYSEMLQLKSRAATGDADAMRGLATIYDRCFQFSFDPANYARTTDETANNLAGAMRQTYTEHRSYVAALCKGFADTGTRVSPKAQALALQSAAQLGSLEAEAELFALGLVRPASPDYHAVLLERILASRSPEAALAISSAMGVGADAKFGQEFAGTQAHVFAWQLAACRMGLDCGPRSRLVTGYCVNGGICGHSFQELLRDHLLPRGEYNRVSEIAQSIQKEMK